MLETSAVWTLLKLCCCLVLFSVRCESLKDLRVSVPTAIRKGETAVFLCDFDLEDEQLYSVKWYKGRKEFYRYTPKDEYPIKIFHNEHLIIDKSKSNATQLTLLQVTPPLSGVYNCEVSAESPSFHTILASGDMTVIEPPLQNPIIQGLKERYRVSDKLDAVCLADFSKPEANITWLLNGDKVHRDYVKVLPPLIDVKDAARKKARSQLSFIVKSHYFKNGMLFIRCTANIMNLTLQSVERTAEESSMVNPEIMVFVSTVDSETRKGNRASALTVHQLIGLVLPMILAIHS